MKTQENLHVTLVQFDIEWEDVEENLSKLDRLLSNIDKTDVVILPEMFATGFTMKPERVTHQSSLIMNWMKTVANRLGAAVCGSIAVEDDGRYYNRFSWVDPIGNWNFYDKRHLFRMGGEDKVYSAGCELTVFEYLGWKIKPIVCYDLRFPVWCRNSEEYDLLLCVANWPSSRDHVWSILAQARAIENQAVFIGVNRIGSDSSGLKHIGNSMVVDERGKVINNITGIEGVVSIVLDRVKLRRFRKSFPAFLDADSFDVTF